MVILGTFFRKTTSYLIGTFTRNISYYHIRFFNEKMVRYTNMFVMPGIVIKIQLKKKHSLEK